MSTITATHNTPVRGDYKVDNSKPLTDAETKAKVIDVQNENLQAIEKGLDKNSAGWGDKVKIKVPADANGQPISNPTAKDWEDAAKNNRFTEVEDVPYRLASNYFSLALANFNDHNASLNANKALIEEFRDALAKGISFPATDSIPRSEKGDIVRAFEARQRALDELERGMGNPKAGTMDPPRERVDIKVPANAEGKPITNPSSKDWIEAQKNNRWVTVSGKPADLASDYYGLKIDMANWRDSYKSNKAAFDQASQEGSKKFDAQIRSASGEYVLDAILDIPNAGKIIAEVLAVLGPAYNTELKKANELREQMDSLKKKNDALQKLEDSISGNDTSGRNPVDFDVPTKRYELDANGNRISTGTTDADGKTIYKTTDVSNPPTNDDWANATEFKSIKELNGGNNINGRLAAEKYFDFKLSSLEKGKDAHTTNLSLNIQKIGNVRSAVQSETSKLSGQFDLRMGNAQTNLQNANKTIASINDMMMSIARGI
jgi:PKD repeat protein